MINRPIATLYDFWGRPITPGVSLIISHLPDTTFSFTMGTVKRIYRDEQNYQVRVELDTDTGRTIVVAPKTLRNHAARPEDAEAWAFGTDGPANNIPEKL